MWHVFAESSRAQPEQLCLLLFDGLLGGDGLSGSSGLLLLQNGLHGLSGSRWLRDAFDAFFEALQSLAEAFAEFRQSLGAEEQKHDNSENE